MNTKVIWSSLFISLYLQGISFYFYIIGAVGAGKIALTGIFQFACVLMFVLISWNIKECRQKLIKFGLLEVLCLAFFGLFIFDFINNPYYMHLPENILFYFTVYTFALFATRGMNFSQFKYTFYFTAFLAILTSFLLCGGFLSGSVSAVADGSRLTSGDSANPIEIGHLGSYAASASLLLSILAKKLGVKLFFLITALPAVLVTVLSGTRSAVISLSIAVAFILITTLLINLKGSGSLLKRLSTTSIIYYTVVIMSIGVLPLASAPGGDSPTSAGKHGFDLSRTLNRVSTIYSLGGEEKQDASVQGRYDLYDQAVHSISENPLAGAKLYTNGFVHNAFLQTTSEYGVLGIITYALPLCWLIYCLVNIIRLSIKQGTLYFKTDAWMITSFTALLLIQAIIIMCFHSDPYRTYFTPGVMGVMIAFSRLGLDEKLKRIKLV